MRRIIYKIQKWIINSLDGVTLSQLAKAIIETNDCTYHYYAQSCLAYAKSLNGQEPEEWCDNMWKYISKMAEDSQQVMKKYEKHGKSEETTD